MFHYFRIKCGLGSKENTMKFSKYLKLNEWEDDFDDTYDEFAEYDERDEREISKCEERLKIELNNLVKKYKLNVDDYEETCFDINGSCNDKLYSELKRIAESCNLILKKAKFSRTDKYHFTIPTKPHIITLWGSRQ